MNCDDALSWRALSRNAPCRFKLMMSARAGDFCDARQSRRARGCLKCLPARAHNYNTQSMPLCCNAFQYTALVPRQLHRFSHPIRCFPLFHAANRHYSIFPHRVAHDSRKVVAMAPKQATLGYVKSSQTTLGCGDTS